MRAALLLLVLLLAGCAEPPRPPPDGAAPTAEQAALAQAGAFDGGRALAFVRAQVCEPGGAAGACSPHYRIPGTEGNNATARLIAAEMAHAGWDVTWDAFTAQREGQPVPAHNVLATKRGSGNGTLMVAAHYDSRPCADEDAVNTSAPVLGANDGGSGVAVMLELAQLLGGRAMNHTLRFAFVDAEDMGDSGHGCGQGTAWAQGAEHDARNLSAAQVGDIRALLLLDLVGDPGLRLPREGLSAQGANRPVLDRVWALGHALGHAQFLDEAGPSIDDDHVPYIRRGVPSVDVIDLRQGSNVFPPSHHTTWDDMDHVSPSSLAAVGQAVLAALVAWDAQP